MWISAILFKEKVHLTYKKIYPCISIIQWLRHVVLFWNYFLMYKFAPILYDI